MLCLCVSNCNWTQSNTVDVARKWTKVHELPAPLLNLIDFLVAASLCYSWTIGSRSATTPRRRLAVSDNSIVSACIDEFSNVGFTVSDAFRMSPVCVAAKTACHAGAEHGVR